MSEEILANRVAVRNCFSRLQCSVPNEPSSGAYMSVLARTVSVMYDVRRPAGILVHNLGSGLDNVHG